MSPSPPTTAETVGALVGPFTLEGAIVKSLERWFPTYLPECIRQSGLAGGQRPEGTFGPPGAIYGAVDLEEWDQEVEDTAAAILVVIEEPDGAPERFESAGYSQDYKLTVGAQFFNDDKHVGRQGASIYIQAAMGIILQQFARDFPDLITEVRMTASPSVILADPDVRLQFTGQVSFEVCVCPVVIDSLGPAEPVPSGQLPPDWPTVEKPIGITVDAIEPAIPPSE
jgi:hypothetical protein